MCDHEELKEVMPEVFLKHDVSCIKEPFNRSSERRVDLQTTNTSIGGIVSIDISLLTLEGSGNMPEIGLLYFVDDSFLNREKRKKLLYKKSCRHIHALSLL